MKAITDTFMATHVRCVLWAATASAAAISLSACGMFADYEFDGYRLGTNPAEHPDGGKDADTDAGADAGGVAPGTPLWTRDFGPALDGDVRGIATDVRGRVLVSGAVFGERDVGGTTVTSAGGYDILVAAYDQLGKLEFARSFGDASVYQRGHSISAGQKGEIVAAGAFNGVVDLGQGPQLAPDVDAFVAKFDPSGAATVWNEVFGTHVDALGVSVDGGNNVILSGHAFSDVDFGCGLQPAFGDGGNDPFVAKFTADGVCLWSIRPAGPGTSQNVEAATVDAWDNVLVAGSFEGTLNWQNHQLISAGGADIFVAKLRKEDGTVLWAKSYGDSENQGAGSIAVDDVGDVFIAGYFEGTMNLGGGEFASAGSGDMFVLKLDGSGNYIWDRHFGGNLNDSANVAADPDGNVYLSGSMESDVDFDGIVFPGGGAGQSDLFLAKLSADNKVLWAEGFGGPGEQKGIRIKVDPSGSVVMSGTFQGTFDLDGLQAPADELHWFVAKFPP